MLGMMVVLTASQNLKLLDSVDVEDRRRHGKDTINNDLRHWKAIKGRSRKQNGVEKETQNKHRSRVTPLSGTDTLNE